MVEGSTYSHEPGSVLDGTAKHEKQQDTLDERAAAIKAGQKAAKVNDKRHREMNTAPVEDGTTDPAGEGKKTAKANNKKAQSRK